MATIEEKAKAYDEAIIRMKAWVHEHPDAQKEAQFVFPELKESRYLKEYDISFGAFDSELIHYEWPLPEGYTAKIEDGKIIIDKSSLTK